MVPRIAEAKRIPIASAKNKHWLNVILTIDGPGAVIYNG